MPINTEGKQEPSDAEKDLVRARFREALVVVYAATAHIPAEEIEEMIEQAVQESRQSRRRSDAA